MALRPPMGAQGRAIREKVILIGKAGSGKTKALMDWADLSQSSGATRTFHVLETDFSQAVERYLGTSYGHLDNVQHTLALTFDEQQTAVDKWMTSAGEEDVLAIDLFAPGIYEAAKQKVDDDKGITSNAERSGDYGKYYGEVNRKYKQLTNQILRWPGHVFGTAATKEPFEGKAADPIMTKMFGFEVEGHKLTRHLFLTNIVMQQVSQTRWNATTLKDLDREYMAGQVVEDWAVDYLVGKAGWRL